MDRLSDHDEDRVVELLGRDVTATLGAMHLDAVRSAAGSLRQFTDDPARYVDRVVEDFQQYVHDCFIDTSWPACPVHPNHPMWFQGGWWVADGHPIAKLGELRALLK